MNLERTWIRWEHGRRATDYREWSADHTRVFQHPGCASCTPAWGFAWSPDGSMWGIGNESGDVSVYRTDGTEVVQTSNPYGNVDVMAWSPDGELLAGGNMLWRLGDGQAVTVGRLVRGRVASLAWSPDCRVIAVTFTDDDRVYLFGRDGSLLAKLVGHVRKVNVVAWSPDGRTLASGSEDRSVRLWRLGDWLARLPNTGAA